MQRDATVTFQNFKKRNFDVTEKTQGDIPNAVMSVKEKRSYQNFNATRFNGSCFLFGKYAHKSELCKKHTR